MNRVGATTRLFVGVCSAEPCQAARLGFEKEGKEDAPVDHPYSASGSRLR